MNHVKVNVLWLLYFQSNSIDPLLTYSIILGSTFIRISSDGSWNTNFCSFDGQSTVFPIHAGALEVHALTAGLGGDLGRGFALVLAGAAQPPCTRALRLLSLLLIVMNC